MSDKTIMRDDGFAQDDWTGEISQEVGTATAIDLDPGADLATIAPHLDRLAMIRVRFGGYADGRGFTVARRLRVMGYTGRLRAAGPIVADQYAMARRAGFDEVELTPEIAARQPEEQWRARANWRSGDYQARLRG